MNASGIGGLVLASLLVGGTGCDKLGGGSGGGKFKGPCTVTEVKPLEYGVPHECELDIGNAVKLEIYSAGEFRMKNPAATFACSGSSPGKGLDVKNATCGTIAGYDASNHCLRDPKVESFRLIKKSDGTQDLELEVRGASTVPQRCNPMQDSLRGYRIRGTLSPAK